MHPFSSLSLFDTLLFAIWRQSLCFISTFLTWVLFFSSLSLVLLSQFSEHHHIFLLLAISRITGLKDFFWRGKCTTTRCVIRRAHSIIKLLLHSLIRHFILIENPIIINSGNCKLDRSSQLIPFKCSAWLRWLFLWRIPTLTHLGSYTHTLCQAHISPPFPSPILSDTCCQTCLTIQTRQKHQIVPSSLSLSCSLFFPFSFG